MTVGWGEEEWLGAKRSVDMFVGVHGARRVDRAESVGRCEYRARCRSVQWLIAVRCDVARLPPECQSKAAGITHRLRCNRFVR